LLHLADRNGLRNIGFFLRLEEHDKE